MLPCVSGLLSADVVGERDVSFIPEDINPKLEFLRQNLLKPPN